MTEEIKYRLTKKGYDAKDSSGGDEKRVLYKIGFAPLGVTITELIPYLEMENDADAYSYIKSIMDGFQDSGKVEVVSTKWR